MVVGCAAGGVDVEALLVDGSDFLVAFSAGATTGGSAVSWRSTMPGIAAIVVGGDCTAAAATPSCERGESERWADCFTSAAPAVTIAAAARPAAAFVAMPYAPAESTPPAVVPAVPAAAPAPAPANPAPPAALELPPLPLAAPTPSLDTNSLSPAIAPMG